MMILLALGTFANTASALTITVDQAISAITTRVPNISWDTLDELRFHGTTSDGIPCTGSFQRLGSTLSISLQHDSNSRGTIMTSVDLNKAQTVDEVSTYNVIKSMKSTSIILDIKAKLELPAQHGDGMPLPASHMNEEMEFVFNMDGTLVSVEMIESNGFLHFGYYDTVCTIQN